MTVFTTALDRDKRLYSIVKRLVLETGRRHAGGYALALILSSFVAGTTAAIIFLIEDVIDQIFVEKNTTALFALAGVVVAVFVARGLAMFAQAVTMQRIANAVVLEVQIKLFRKVLGKEPSALTESSSGELLTVITKSATACANLLNALANAIGRDALTIAALIVVLFIQDATLAIGIALALPIIALIVTQVTRRLRALAREALQITALLTDRMRAGVQGMRVIKAFAMEKEFGDGLVVQADRFRRVLDKFAVVSNRVAPFMELTGGVAIAGAIALGGWRVIEGGVSPGQLVSFIMAAVMAYDPARRLGLARAVLERELVSVRSMYDFLDEKEQLVDAPNAQPLTVARGEVRFDHVSFGYDAEKPVLSGMSFVARAGETTAIVGRSGGGKTTIVNLLLRFWRPGSGAVLVDGQDIAAHTAASLRESIAYVGQDAFLFDGAIRDNIMVGDRGADDATLIAAAKAAGAYDFITNLPGGFDALVGELGANLSGGQRQRIAIARALLRDSPIVVLDEPTSALDSHTEREIQASLRRLAADRTTIVIAHRLSTVRTADQILVVEHGRVVESGTHDALIAAGGAYAALYGESEGAPAPV